MAKKWWGTFKLKQKLSVLTKGFLVFLFEPYLVYKVKEKSWKRLVKSSFLKNYRIIYLESSFLNSPYVNCNIFYFDRNQYENLIYYFDQNEKLFFLNNKHEIAYALRFLTEHNYKVYVNKD